MYELNVTLCVCAIILLQYIATCVYITYTLLKMKCSSNTARSVTTRGRSLCPSYASSTLRKGLKYNTLRGV